jgi:hypothetical protein
MSMSLKDLFSRYAIPPSPLHEAVQAAARQAGWAPPWDREEQHKEQQNKKKMMGKNSGLLRAWYVDLRRSLIPAARTQLKPTNILEPYAVGSIDALKKQYLELLAEGGNNLTEGGDDFVSLIPSLLAELPKTHRQALTKVGRETLRKDLKAHGIRSKRRIPRSG